MSARNATVRARKEKGFTAAANVERSKTVEHSMLLGDLLGSTPPQHC
jgi:hypothetical protein